MGEFDRQEHHAAHSFAILQQMTYNETKLSTMFDKTVMIEHLHANPLPAGSPLTILLFGSFQIIVAEQPESKFRTNKSRALLAYLLLARGQSVLRTSLIELLWPGYRKESALASLRQVLTDLRKAFAPLKVLHTDYHSVRLLIDPTVIACDALRFDALLDACAEHAHPALTSCPLCQQRLQEALALYTGPFLANFPAVDSVPFQRWIESQRQHYADRVVHSQAVLRPLGTTTVKPRGNLPTPLTPLLGRTRTLQELADRLQHPVYRCLTLVGPGGIGKTRLALALGAQQTAFPDGVWFVDLAALAPPMVASNAPLVAGIAEATIQEQLHDRLATAILTARGLTLQRTTRPSAQLLTYLQDKTLLLILDNFEHLSAAADFLAQLLQGAPLVRLLITSRHRLALQGQLLYQVTGLAWPAATTVAAVATDQLVAQYASLQLFLERATLTHSDLRLDAPTLTAIVAICQAVEGIPLAIELAAALLEKHAPATIGRLVRTNYQTLQSSYQDLPPRQRSAQAVLHTAWQLLTAEEAQTLACCAVFQGGFTHNAAQTVAGATPRTLEALLHKSLLHQTVIEPSLEADKPVGGEVGTVRYHMHELVRQFATEQLRQQTKLAQTTHARHATYYLALVTTWQPTAEAEQIFRAAMQADLENVESAWHWALTSDQITQLIPAVEGMTEFYEMVGAFHAAAALLQLGVAAVHTQLAATAVTAVGEAATAVQSLQTLLASLLMQLGYVYSVGLAQLQTARPFAEEALALAQSLEDAKLIVRSYHVMAAIAYGESQFTQGEAFCRSALQLAQEYGLHREEIMCLSALGLTISGYQDFTTALHYLRPALALAEATGDLRKAMLVRNQLGGTYRDMGDFSQALHYFEHNLLLTQQNNDAYTIAVGKANLGFLHLLLGNYPAAAAALEAGYQRFHSFGETQLMYDCLAVLGYLRLLQGDYEEASEIGQHILAQSGIRISAQQVVWLTLGDLYTAQGDWPAAQIAYTQLAALGQQTEEMGIKLLGQCGAARTLVAQQQAAAALAALEALLPHFAPTRFDTFFSAPRFLLAAYEILAANEDPRAATMLQQAWQIVTSVAEQLSDPQLRASYLTNVAINRRVGELVRAKSMRTEVEQWTVRQ